MFTKIARLMINRICDTKLFTDLFKYILLKINVTAQQAVKDGKSSPIRMNNDKISLAKVEASGAV
jgi:hypothetical protein